MKAPVIIPTLCRAEHFIRLVESLKKNTLAQVTDVIVGLDYPSKAGHYNGYYLISKYLDGDFTMFKSFVVFKRESNYGSERNLQCLIDYATSRYDRFVKTDDDAEFSPNFLEYINNCLDKYEHDEDVIAVTGYSYPLKWKTSEQANVFKENFICPMWGTGFWTKKYRKIEELIVKDNLLQVKSRDIILRGGFKKMTDVCRQEFVDLCLSPDYNITLAAKVTDVSVRMYMAACDKYVIAPTISKVRNWGFDGTGEFCGFAGGRGGRMNAKSYQYHLQKIDEKTEFVLLQDYLCDNSDNRKLMNVFDPISMKARVKTFFKAMLFVLLGKRLFEKMTLKLRELR